MTTFGGRNNLRTKLPDWKWAMTEWTFFGIRIKSKRKAQCQPAMRASRSTLRPDVPFWVAPCSAPATAAAGSSLDLQLVLPRVEVSGSEPRVTPSWQGREDCRAQLALTHSVRQWPGKLGGPGELEIVRHRAVADVREVAICR